MAEKFTATKAYRGNCHCGAYVFEAKLPEVTQNNTCNCSICHKKGYSWALSKAQDITWIKGNLKDMKGYTFATHQYEHKFCETCGTPMAFVGYLSPLEKGEEREPDVGINTRCIQNGQIPNIWDMEKAVINGRSFGSAYKPPQYNGPKPKKEVDGGKLYTGSCHCGAVKVALMSKPLEKSFDEPIYECNCSGCIRAAGSCVYPDQDQLVVEGEENTTGYSYGGLKAWEKFFCKECGVFIGRRPLPIPEEVVAKLPEIARKWTVDIHHLRPINLRIMDDVNIEELNVTHVDGYNNIPPIYSEEFDQWTPESFKLSPEQIKDIISKVPQQTIDDIKTVQESVRAFALEQRKSITDFEYEIRPGVHLGQKNIPISTVGASIPGGRYPLLASAHMTIITAKAAGVSRVIACTPPIMGEIPPATVAAIHLAGADDIFILGGVQAVAAMAIGTDTVSKVDFIAGPSNAFVAEAKRQLFGEIGIDLPAGPTEVLIIADEYADPFVVATDLLSQAEHGPDTPAVLITNSQSIAQKSLVEVDRLLQILPTATIAAISWARFGEIQVTETLDEAFALGDTYASEHVQILTESPRQALKKMSNYGALFLGEGTCVSYGDKARISFPSHFRRLLNTDQLRI